MKKTIKISMFAMMLIVSSCTSTINKKISIKTLNEDLVELKKDYSKEYTEKDFKAVDNFAASKFFSTMMSGGVPSIEITQTYKDILEEAKAKRLIQEKEDAEYQAKINEFKKVVDVTVNSVTLVPADEFNIAQNLDVNYTYKNTSTKDIKGFKGAMQFNDMFDKTIATLSVECTAELKVAQSQKDIWTYETFDSDIKKVGLTELSKMKVSWTPITILFSDGTEMNLPQPKN